MRIRVQRLPMGMWRAFATVCAVLLSACSSPPPSVAQSGPCSADEEARAAALRRSALDVTREEEKRFQDIDRAVGLCPNVDNLLAQASLWEALSLSKAEKILQGDPELPTPPRWSALGRASTPEEVARVSLALARLKVRMDESYEAVPFYRAYLHVYPHDAQAREEVRQVEMRHVGEVTSAKDIYNTLAKKQFGLSGYQPSVDLRIQFATDRADLMSEARAQVRELASALRRLSDPAAASGAPGRFHFMVIGHADRRGDDEHNRDLSRRRAETVRDTLVRDFGFRGEQFTVVGRGETQPLYPGTSDEDHRLNRRVEIQVTD